MADDQGTTREITFYERSRWGTCELCEAKHGKACRADVGVPLGKGALNAGVHLVRLQAAPDRVDNIPSPIFTDSLITNAYVTFGWWDRIRILFGWRLHVHTRHETLIDRTRQAPMPETRSWVFNPRAKPSTVTAGGGMLEAP